MKEENKHFFKILIPGFHNKLNLPPSFCKKLKQEKSEWAILTSRKGTSKIKVCRNSDGLISFKVGWPKFVEQHSLSVGNFIVFEHIGRLNFNVFIFDPSCCEKEFLNESNENAANPCGHKKIGKGKQRTVASYNSRNPHFITTMRRSHEKYSDLYIPMEFMKLNNLQGKTSAALRVGCKKSWSMTLCARKSQYFRLSLGVGWRDFYVSNKLKVGDVCAFYLNSNKLKVGDVCAFYLNSSPPTSKTILFDVKIQHQS